VGDFGATVVSDNAATAALDICCPEIVVVGSRQCHAEAKTPRE